MEKKEIETFCPANQQHWRLWLQENHQSKQSVWLVYYKKKTSYTSLEWSEAVDEALCFGWIDSTRKPLDHERFLQLFTKRKPNSTWSKINKEKINRLIDTGKMTDAGLKIIETAKQNGSWTILDAIEELTIPDELEKAFEANPDSKIQFLNLSKSVRKAILHRIVMAKQQETKQKRIAEAIELISQKQKPKLL